MCEEGLQHERLHKSQSHTNILIWAFAQSALAVESGNPFDLNLGPKRPTDQAQAKASRMYWLWTSKCRASIWYSGQMFMFMLLCVWYYHSVTCGAILSDCDNQCTSWLKQHKACQQKSICVPLPYRHNLFQNCNVPRCHTPHIFASSQAISFEC